MLKNSFLLLLFINICFSIPLPVPKIAEPPTPPFLQNSPKSVIESFYNLIGNAHYLTDKEIDQEIERWVMKQSDDVQVSIFRS
jgi:galactose-1-phosphate uridylyltransferase